MRNNWTTTIKLIQSFLNNRLQRVVLNGQPVHGLLCLLVFHRVFVRVLIYINDLVKGISSTAKLFADDTSIFSAFNDINVSADQTNKGLEKISM